MNEDNVPAGKLQEKNMKKLIIFLYPQSHWRKASDPELDPDALVRGTDQRNRIRTKMSRITSTICISKKHQANQLS
jgi:hypothetical protein